MLRARRPRATREMSGLLRQDPPQRHHPPPTRGQVGRLQICAPVPETKISTELPAQGRGINAETTAKAIPGRAGSKGIVPRACRDDSALASPHHRCPAPVGPHGRILASFSTVTLQTRTPMLETGKLSLWGSQATWSQTHSH